MTYGYCAPEQIIYNFVNQISIKTSSIDIWALGCVLYEIITGECFVTDEEAYITYMTKHFNDKKWMSDRINIIEDERMRNLLCDMLTIEASKRPTAIQILDKLKVSFEIPLIFNQYDTYTSGRNILYNGFPDALHKYLSNLLDIMTWNEYSMCNDKTYAGKIDDYKYYNKEYKISEFVKRDIQKQYTIHELVWMVLIIIDRLFLHRWENTLSCINPYYDKSMEYMVALKDIIFNYKMAWLFIR
jgi:serine/threonine protein kinase